MHTKIDTFVFTLYWFKLYIIWLFYLSILSVHDEGYSSVVRTKFDIYVFNCNIPKTSTLRNQTGLLMVTHIRPTMESE
jgi:hypothetical protein